MNDPNDFQCVFVKSAKCGYVMVVHLKMNVMKGRSDRQNEQRNVR